MKGMTAGDVVDKFKRRPEGSTVYSRRNDLSQQYRNCVNPHNENKFAHDSHYLFEVGGNIGKSRMHSYFIFPVKIWILESCIIILTAQCDTQMYDYF
jgi:hypothetical protein